MVEKKMIYLCGPIQSCTDGECMDWRENVKQRLAGVYEFLDPMRRDYRGVTSSHVQEIVENDYKDIDNCDILLANITKLSWGSIMEIRYAYENGKTVVVVCDNANDWAVCHSHLIVPELDMALSLLATKIEIVRQDKDRTVVEESYRDIGDVLILDANQPSWESAMKIHYAYMTGKKVIVAYNGSDPSPWLVYHSHKLGK